MGATASNTGNDDPENGGGHPSVVVEQIEMTATNVVGAAGAGTTGVSPQTTSLANGTLPPPLQPDRDGETTGSSGGGGGRRGRRSAAPSEDGPASFAESDCHFYQVRIGKGVVLSKQKRCKQQTKF